MWSEAIHARNGAVRVDAVIQQTACEVPGVITSSAFSSLALSAHPGALFQEKNVSVMGTSHD